MTRKTRATVPAGHCVALADEYASICKMTGMTARQSARVGSRQDAIEKELARTPAPSMGDIIAKARVLAEWERQVFPGSAKLAASIKSDLERHARPAGDDAAILALAEEYHAIPKTFPQGTTDEELGVNAKREMEITQGLPAMPAATLAGIRFKVVALGDLVEGYDMPELNKQFVASILADLTRMARGVP